MDRQRISTRRHFLKVTAGLSAGALMPMIVPRHVLGTETTPSANERIGIGGIGIGRRGLQLFEEIPSLGRVVAIADVNLPRAEKTAEPYRAVAYQDYRKLLERKDVDAIITATPDHWRAIVCIHACQAGKDIYAEKPMSLTIYEGRKMVEAVRKYDRVFQTGSQQRSMAANRLGCELVRNGRIGKVHTVIAANYPSPWECALPGQPVPAGLDWDMWCGPTEPVPYHIDLYTPRANPGWISFRPYSGGEMTGWGAHGLDQIQWALGTDDTGPGELWPERGRNFLRRHIPSRSPVPVAIRSAVSRKSFLSTRVALSSNLTTDRRAERFSSVIRAESPLTVPNSRLSRKSWVTPPMTTFPFDFMSATITC